MKSTFARQFSLTAGMILLSFLVLGVGFISLIYNYLMNERKSALASSASAVAELAAVSYDSYGSWTHNWDLSISLVFASRVSESDAVICDSDGTIALCSCSELFCDHMGQKVSDRYVTAVLDQTQLYTSGTLDGIYDNAKYIFGVPIVLHDSDEAVGIVFVSADASDLTEMLYKYTSTFLLSGLVVMLLAFLMTLIITKRTVRPLNEMAQAARRFGKGELAVRVRNYGREDEIGELAAAFNSMAQSLEHTETNRREFVANVSHELKTPMTTISGYIDGILDGTIPEEQQAHYLQIVSDETKRLSRLVRKMLELSRIQGGSATANLEKFDISELLGQVLLSFEGKITAKNLDVDAQLSEDPMMVMADYDGITQVVYNLLDNAIKFSPENGQLWLHLEKQGVKAYVTVGNNGSNIPEHELPLIFERFHKTDRSRSTDRDGVGLGLYIVKTIVNSLDEEITVTSEDGRTEFRFTLTLAKGK